jgi:hypothetical protein
MDSKITHEGRAAAPKPPDASAKTGRARRAKRKQKPPCVAPGKQNGSAEAKKNAAAVLEVLGGERRPREAAEALGVSVMRYYVVESRALQGLLDACEPRPRGPRVRPQKRVAELQRQVDTLRRDIARYQALARACNRTVGIAPVKSAAKTKKGGRKRRTPTVRALKAVAGFRSAVAEGATTDAAQTSSAS